MKRLFFIFTTLFLFFIGSWPVNALTITPGKINVSAEAGKAVLLDISLYNETQEDLVIIASAEEFEADPQGRGMPHFISSKPNGITTWIKTPQNAFAIKKAENKKIPLAIEVSSSVSSGGYYAAVFFEGKPANAGLSTVGVSTRVGVLVFLTVKGQLIENGVVEKFVKSGDNFEVVVKNNGNVHLQPEGDIEVSNVFGLTADKQTINTSDSLVLPNSSRIFEVKQNIGFWQKIQRNILSVFGYFKAVLKINNMPEATLTYWEVPWVSILILLLIIFAIYIVRRG